MQGNQYSLEAAGMSLTLYYTRMIGSSACRAQPETSRAATRFGGRRYQSTNCIVFPTGREGGGGGGGGVGGRSGGGVCVIRVIPLALPVLV